ncbi:t-SNARE domain-containing protein 1 [Folsomia candida]|uniref:Regulatory protein zeste n=1 Tax=Folsomia candida TaxID=158441 RepID=A0A226DIN5_FOLCA|nr:t-SNARE domain-containing protein 1 [Folsomia candida]
MALTTLTGNITKTEGAKRSPNFTSLEKEVLVDEIVANLSLLFGQFTTKITPEIQSEAWGRVLLKVNALGVVPGGRKLSEIKKKYQQLKSEVKTKGAAIKRELNETGGGESALSQLDDLQEKILSTPYDKPTMKTTTARNHVPRCTPSSRSEEDPSINESPRPTNASFPRPRCTSCKHVKLPYWKLKLRN